MAIIDTLEWPPSALAAIERLTAERDLALANADGVYAKLMAENERLRSVLNEALPHLKDYDLDDIERYHLIEKVKSILLLNHSSQRL